jgi:hypothetical protein
MRLVFSTQDIPAQLMESMLHPPIVPPTRIYPAQHAKGGT